MKSLGPLITIEGIDGSGKDTVARTILSSLLKSGHKIFDVDAWSKEHGTVPFPEDTEEAGVIFFSEPTYIWIGGAIRQELVRRGTAYSALTVAEAFSLDRLIIFNRLILPLRTAGKIIIQQRNVCSSLVYQPIQKEPLSIETIMELPGNALELKEAPDFMIIASCEPQTALERTTGREGKQDNSIFEKLEFLQKLHARYHSDWLAKIWTDRQTKVQYINANQPLEKMKADATALTESIFKNFGP